MSQCVPSWDIEDTNCPNRFSLRSNPNPTTAARDHVPMLDHEVAELTWENGQLLMHGLGQPRVQPKPITPPTASPSKYTWDKPRASGTLESIVNQATRFPPPPPHPHNNKLSRPAGNDELVPWFDHHRCGTASAIPAAVSATMTTDALVPCANHANHHGTCVIECSTRVGSCSGATATYNEEAPPAAKGARGACVPNTAEWSGRIQSTSGSVATYGRDNVTVTTTNTTATSQRVTLGTCERETSFNGSHDDTSMAKTGTTNKTLTVDENDSVSHSRPQREEGEEQVEEEKRKGNGKSSVSTKRSRAAAIHNQSERKRRDKINQRMKTLQKLVPNSSKTDKASMLDEVIDYLKQLKAQVEMMNRMSMQTMMLPMAIRQQLQMSMMAAATPMSMAASSMGMPGMGIGHHVMDFNSLCRPNIPVLHPTAAATTFLPVATSWGGASGGGGDRFAATAMSDPMSVFLACQPQQPMTMDAYTRLATMYQQLQQQQHQHPTSISKN